MEQTKAKKSTFKKIKTIISWVIMIALVLVVAVILITRINGNTPSFMGYSIYRISSGSMEPTLEVGDVILVKECEPQDLQIGDIVTFQGEGIYEGKIITHRVIKATYEENGQLYFDTKGDANKNDDPVNKAESLYGRMETTIPWLNFLYDFFLTPWGLLAIIGIIILAFIDDIIKFFKAVSGTGIEEEKKEDINDIIARIQQEEQAKKSQNKDK